MANQGNGKIINIASYNPANTISRGGFERSQPAQSIKDYSNSTLRGRLGRDGIDFIAVRTAERRFYNRCGSIWYSAKCPAVMDAQTIRRLFVAVLDLAPDERSALLAQECSSDAERKAVLDLLSFDQGEGESNTIGGPISGMRREAVTGRFGPYEVLEIIGRGGMGAVYRAERVDGEVRQVVAIKILDREWLDGNARPLPP